MSLLQYATCTVAYHVTCGFYSGLEMKVSHDVGNSLIYEVRWAGGGGAGVCGVLFAVRMSVLPCGVRDKISMSVVSCQYCCVWSTVISRLLVLIVHCTLRTAITHMIKVLKQ